MRVAGIGIDIVEISRIAESIERHGEAFLSRLFTSNERHYCESRSMPAMHYAARFAAKEAVAKAFGTGIGERAAFLDLEIINNAAGAPQVVLGGSAKKHADDCGITEIQVSLTHSREYAAANAVVIAG
ncbi:MAG: holo-ACP synthase [Verrucomicrobiota bacterium]|jgi:holo-[acyl-carrier protein] synthase